MPPAVPAECDVAIIGGGPAGATTASLLRKMNPKRRVVVLEKARFPRHHIGESTLPEMNRILHKMGALEKIERAGFVRKRGITYKWASDKPPFSDVFSTGVLDALVGTSGQVPDYSWQVERSRYDAILLSHARELGADVFEDTQATGLMRDGDRIRGLEVVQDGKCTPLRAEFVVDCSGQARVLSSWLHLDKQAHALGDLGIYRYYEGFRWSPELVGSLAASRIFFQAARRGWMWFIPLSERLVSVGLVTRREFLKQTPPVALFDEELATLPEIAGMLEGAVMAPAPADPDPTPRTHTIADWSYSHAAPAGPGYYLAGDAAAFVDPILSSGVLLAHQSGLSVANAINTHWTASDVTEAELHAAYADFYRDLYGGFLRMAHWWYTRRAVGIDEWLKLARELGNNAIGAQEIGDNDSASFMTFAAGFLSDFRFVNVGCGFGDKGLGLSMDGVEGTSVGHRLNLELRERTIRLRSKIHRMDTSEYLATDIGTDRWWRLPVIHLFGDWGEDKYRPPVLGRPHSDQWVTTCLRAIERVLRCCDGSMSLERAVGRTVMSFPRDDQQQIRKLCDLVLAGLYVKGMLEPA